MRLGLLAIVLLAGCPPEDPCAGTRDLATSPSGLELTESEHPGWGRHECFQCHAVTAFHAHDCFSGADIDVAALGDHIDPDDPSTCTTCHGTNGVTWNDPADTGGTR